MMLSNIGNLDNVNQVQMEQVVKSNGTCNFAAEEKETTCAWFCPVIGQVMDLLIKTSS